MTLWQQKLIAWLVDEESASNALGTQYRASVKAWLDGRKISSQDCQHLLDELRPFFPGPFSGDNRVLKSSEDFSIPFHHSFTGQPLSIGSPDVEALQGWMEKWMRAFQGVTDYEKLFWECWQLSSHGGDLNTHSPMDWDYIPANPRQPDFSLWQLKNFRSALVSCRNRKGQIKPAFLYFEAKSPPGFYASSKTIIDRASSHLLSCWMMSHAIGAVVADLGPDSILYPCISSLPWSSRFKRSGANATPPLETSNEQNANSFWWNNGQFIPGFSTHFIALAPEDYVPDLSANQFDAYRPDSEWRRIIEYSRDRQAAVPYGPIDKHIWQAHAERFWRVKWQVMPWLSIGELTEELGRISRDDQDMASRLKKPLMENSVGWQWAANCLILMHRAQSLGQTCTFKAHPIPKQFFENSKEGKNSAKYSQGDDLLPMRATAVTNSFSDFSSIVTRTWPKAVLSVPQECQLPNSVTQEHALHEAADTNHGCAFLALGIRSENSLFTGFPGLTWEAVFDCDRKTPINASNKIQKDVQNIPPLCGPHLLHFSEALNYWSLLANYFITGLYGGRVISAHNDQIAAALPKHQIWECAEVLRWLFVGSTELAMRFPDFFQEAPKGFVRIASGAKVFANAVGPKPKSGTYMMPGDSFLMRANFILGNTSLSEGHAIRQIDAWLQNSNSSAECTVSLFGLTGNPWHWHFGWNSPIFELIDGGRRFIKQDELLAVIAVIMKIQERVIAYLRQPGLVPDPHQWTLFPKPDQNSISLIINEYDKLMQPRLWKKESLDPLHRFSDVVRKYWLDGNIQTVGDCFGPFYTLKAMI